MITNLNLKNIDDLIYLEDTPGSFNYDEVSTYYLKKLRQNKKQIKRNPSLFIYDYRPPLSDDVELDNPAIQPHDSEIESIVFNHDEVHIKGNGTSYMNYKDYDIEIKFNGVSDISLIESRYVHGKKEEMRQLSFEEVNVMLSQFGFKEVFLDESAILKSEINFILVQYHEQEQDKRNIIILKFEYDSVYVNCSPRKL